MILLHESAVAIRPYSIGELAQIYGVDYRTLKKWLKPLSRKLGKKRGRYYSIDQVCFIFQRLKIPGKAIALNPNEGGKTVYLNLKKQFSVVLTDS
jgi:hypothetical protein